MSRYTKEEDVADRTHNLRDDFAGEQGFSPSEVEPPLAEDFGEPIIYGLDFNKSSHHSHRNSNSSLWIIIAAIAIALALIAGYLVFRTLGKRNKNEAANTPIERPAAQEEQEAEEQEEAEVVEEAQPAEPVEPEPQQQEGYTLPDQPTNNDIKQQAKQLVFDGTDLSVPENELGVEVRGGRVQVTHTPGGGVDATAVAGNAARRAAALATAIGQRSVKGEGEEAANPFSAVTWIVRNADGDSYLAVCFGSDGIPTSGDGLSVLAQSPRYRLSDGLFQALGGSIPQEVGETPSLLSGEYIWSTATI